MSDQKGLSSQVDKQPEASQVIEKLCGLEDHAYANRNTSRSLMERMFGSEEDQPELKNEGTRDPQCWFDVVNQKLLNIYKADQETGDNLNRISNGMTY